MNFFPPRADLRSTILSISTSGVGEFIFFVLWFFGRTVLWIQGFMLVKQVLYTWITALVHFVLIICEMGSC
jgi:hypothetical protein